MYIFALKGVYSKLLLKNLTQLFRSKEEAFCLPLLLLAGLAGFAAQFVRGLEGCFGILLVEGR